MSIYQRYTCKDIHGKAEYVLLPVQVYNEQIEDELAGLDDEDTFGAEGVDIKVLPVWKWLLE